MIEVKDISVRFGHELIVAPCHFYLDTPSVTAIVGPNGAGKSTLLRVLSGDKVEFDGLCKLEGQSIDSWDTRSLAERRAVVKQFSRIGFPFTVEEIVGMGRSPFDGIENRCDRSSAIVDAMSCMDVQHLADRLYPSLSGGEQQRVSIARGLCQINAHRIEEHRRYILLDEPTASLDLKHQHKLLALLRSLTERGVIVVVVLHDLNLALKYCDNVLLVKKNAQAKFGSASEILNVENINDTFELSASLIGSSETENLIHVISHRRSEVRHNVTSC